METTINQRIKNVIDDSGLTINSFSKKIGIAQTSLRDCIVKNAEPKFSTLDKIIKAVPLINPEWLLTGNGNMKKNEGDFPVDNNSTVFSSSIDEDGTMLRVIESQQRTIEKLTDLVINFKR